MPRRETMRKRAEVLGNARGGYLPHEFSYIQGTLRIGFPSVYQAEVWNE